jgi:ribosome assembly protein YihI (activator of Der GTPase)
MSDIKDKLRAARRELLLRRSLYPRRVKDGKLKQEVADHEIAVMEAIVADYEKALEAQNYVQTALDRISMVLQRDQLSPQDLSDLQTAYDALMP